MGLGPQRKDSKTFGTLTHPNAYGFLNLLEFKCNDYLKPNLNVKISNLAVNLTNFYDSV